MSLSSGTRLGSYEIAAPLGAGGMGEVYRAWDSKLNRHVALKVLPAALAGDADYIARFQREAQVLASLNHPNIAAIYGLEDSGGVRALVMELVEGPTLDERISAGAIPIGEALEIARQIAEALEAAHDKGIIHRDLKPANVKVTADDKVKVLDFGLAKALTGDSGMSSSNLTSSPTMTIHMTQAGMILGTAAYMSPEQAKGKAVDRRADIWAFGVVLIEMLTGRRAYEGETPGEILASVIKDPPPLAALPPNTPAPIRRLLSRCLDKDPKRRLRDIGEARIVIEEVLAGRTPTDAVEATPEHSASPRGSLLPWIMAASLGIAAIIAGVGWWRGTKPVLRPLVRFDIDLGMGSGADRPIGPRVVISPDGTRVVFPAQDSSKAQRLFTRLLDQAEASPLNGTEGGDFPFFSPDSQWLGFVSNGKLKKVSVLGGAPQTLCDAPRLRGASWGPGFIAAALDTRGVIARVPEDGGPPQPLSITDTEKKEVTHRFPFVLPGGKVLLFGADSRGGSYEEADLVAQSLETGKRKVLFHGGYFPRYVASPGGPLSRNRGYLLFMSQRVLFAAPMDADGLTLTGPPRPMVEGVAATPTSGGAQFDVSQNGILIFQKGGNEGETTFNWLDSSNRIQQLSPKPAVYTWPTLSPDGRKFAFSMSAGSGGMWIYDLERDTASRIMFESSNRQNRSNGRPLWSPDGKHLVYGSSMQDAILWIRSDGGGEPQVLLKGAGDPVSFSPDGKQLAVARAGYGSIQLFPIEGAGTDHPVAGQPENWKPREWDAEFSPDGHWVAYMSDESGRNEVYVRAYPGPGGKWQVSMGGGVHPIWSPKARELFYANEALRIMVAPYTVNGDAFVPEKPRVWADHQISNILTSFPAFDISPDGKRFLVLLHPEALDSQHAHTPVTVMLNFTDELRRRMRNGS